MSDAANEFVSKEERRLFRRIALRMIPLLFLCYIVAMLDRLNVGFAKLQFLSDLHMSEAVFGTAAGLLYLGYVLFEVPSNLMLQKYGVRVTLLRIMSLWGIFTILLAFANTNYEFYGLRFLVGLPKRASFPAWFFTCPTGSPTVSPRGSPDSSSLPYLPPASLDRRLLRGSWPSLTVP